MTNIYFRVLYHFTKPKEKREVLKNKLLALDLRLQLAISKVRPSCQSSTAIKFIKCRVFEAFKRLFEVIARTPSAKFKKAIGKKVCQKNFFFVTRLLQRAFYLLQKPMNFY